MSCWDICNATNTNDCVLHKPWYKSFIGTGIVLKLSKIFFNDWVRYVAHPFSINATLIPLMSYSWHVGIGEFDSNLLSFVACFRQPDFKLQIWWVRVLVFMNNLVVLGRGYTVIVMGCFRGWIRMASFNIVWHIASCDLSFVFRINVVSQLSTVTLPILYEISILNTTSF